MLGTNGGLYYLHVFLSHTNLNIQATLNHSSARMRSRELNYIDTAHIQIVKIPILVSIHVNTVSYIKRECKRETKHVYKKNRSAHPPRS